MNSDYKKFLPHILVIIGFIVVAVAYFNPVLSGKVLNRGDINQARAMHQENNDFRKEHGTPTFWVDNAFGGMPTYFSAPKYPNNFIKSLGKKLKFLPTPTDHVFLYLIGLYILLLVMKVDYKLAALGALAFAFSTYLIIIIGVGHNIKSYAIAYMPMVLASIILVFRKRYLWGGLFLAVSLALELSERHFQITYYLLFVVLILGLVYLYQAYKDKKLPDFFKSVGVMAIAAVLALAANATTIMASQQYSSWSTRGDTGLTIDANGNEKRETGLDYDYITEYSYGFAETMNLFIPRFMGGGSTETLDKDSHAYKSLIDAGAQPQQAQRFIENAPTYWGEQPIVAAPAYIGATVIFLFIMALYLVKGPLKWWIVGASILALVLSWGKNVGFITKFFINYVPLYSKFRTVSMIQVILELLLPFFGVYGLTKLFSDKIHKSAKLHALKWTSIITAGASVFFLLFKNVLFDFSGMHDQAYLQNIGRDFVDALKKDRVAMLNSDTVRSLVFVVLMAATVLACIKEKLSRNLALVIVTVLILADLISIDRNYVNNDDFVNKSDVRTTFTPNKADKEIMKDKGHYRVLDLSENPFNSARASKFHNSIGGYHGAKPGRYQELYDFYIKDYVTGGKGDQDILNMLNTKYYIIKTKEGVEAQTNREAFGNAWFVDNVDFVDSANDEILTLDSISPKNTAVVNNKFKDLIPQTEFEDHQDDEIHLKHYQANKLEYDYSAADDRLAVFSEIYYPHGWKIQVDGEDLNMAQADYVLRAVYLPKGQHTVTFKFDPAVVNIGNKITMATGILFALLVLGGLVYTFRNPKKLK